MKRLVTVLIAAMFGLTACGPDDDDLSFDGQFFRTKLKKDGERHQFVVTAKPVSASLLGAREAARYEATRFCVTDYGSSKIIWTAGPDAPDDTLAIESDVLTLRGECPL